MKKTMIYLVMVLLLVGSITAANPGHSASSVSAGTFEAGNFTFPNDLHVNNLFYPQIHNGAPVDDATGGALFYDSSLDRLRYWDANMGGWQNIASASYVGSVVAGYVPIQGSINNLYMNFYNITNVSFFNATSGQINGSNICTEANDLCLGTLYSAGTGLILSTTTFSTNDTYLQIFNETALAESKVSPDQCPPNEIVQNVTTGGVQCIPLPTIVNVTGTNITFINTYNQDLNTTNDTIFNSVTVQDLYTKTIRANSASQIILLDNLNVTATTFKFNEGDVCTDTNGQCNIYNDSAINTTANFQLLGFNTTAQLNNQFLNITDQRYNDSAAVALKASTGNCAAGQAVQNTTTSGVQCVTLPVDTDTIGIATVATTDGYIIVQNGTVSNFSLNDTKLNSTIVTVAAIYNDTALANQKVSPGDCPAGQVVQNTTTSGVQCVAQSASTDTVWNITGSAYLYNNSGILSVNETKLNSTIDALDNDTTYSAGTGLTLSTTTFAVNDTYLQRYNDSAINTTANFQLLGFNTTAQLYSLFWNKTTELITLAQALTGLGNATAVNTTANIQLLGFNTTAQLNNQFLNITDQRYNDSAAVALKASTGNCAAGQAVQNTTTSGVQCVTLSSGSTYDQTLNTTSDVKFNTLNTTGNINATTANVSATYFYGAPMSSLGSGIISASSVTSGGDLSVNYSGLQVTYPNVTVILTQTDPVTMKYCNVVGATVTVPAEAHTYYYVNNTCGVESMSFISRMTRAVSPGGTTDLFNVMADQTDIEFIDGTILKARVDNSVRNHMFYTDHLKVVSGFNLGTMAWPTFNISEGKYDFLRDVDTATAQVSNAGNKIEFVYHNTSTTWKKDTNIGLNITQCDNGTALNTCTGNNYRRYFMFVQGYNRTTDSTQLYQTAGLESTSYSSLANCLDTTTNPIVWNVPSYYQYTLVPLYAYCAKRTETSWVASQVIDLRGRVSGIGGAGGSSVDTTVFLLTDGTRAATTLNVTNAFNVGGATTLSSTLNVTSNITTGNIIKDSAAVTRLQFNATNGDIIMIIG